MSTARIPTLAEIQGFPAALARLIAEEARRQMGQGKLGDARVLVDGLLATNPLDPALHLLDAQLKRREGRTEEAVAACAVAAELDPKMLEVRLIVAEIRLAAGQRDAAKRELLAVVGGEGNSAGRARALLKALGG
jgi:predicted Zn-dependent protease